MSPVPDTPGVVTVSIVGTGHEVGGGVAPVPNGTILSTPGIQPDIKMNVVTPLLAGAVRFIHEFLQAFLGVLTAAGIGVGTGAAGAVGIAPDMATVVWGAAATAGITAGLGAIRNLITIFGRLEGKYPLLTGGI